MRSLVVFFAFASVACGSLVQIAQPAHHPALVLDPHGRPLDTAEVINARAIHLQAKALEGHHGHVLAAYAPIAHSVIAPAADSHQSRLDVISSPAVVSHDVIAHAAPIVTAHAGLLGHSALDIAGHGHYLKKRSLGHFAVALAPSAVSHQSRVDVHTSPAVVAHSVVAAPVYTTHSILSAPIYGAHSVWGAHSGLGHLLKKRSLALAPLAHAYTLPAATSHQSRYDVISRPAVVSHAVAAPVIAHAEPLAIAHAAPAVYAAPAAVSHQSRVDVSSHLAPIAHSAVWTSPLSHWSHTGLLHSASLGHGALW